MTRARNQIISVDDTPYYHCIARCVRRAFLCGEDPVDKRSYEHRRQWIVDRLTELEDIFCIAICAYAVMSNHYHVVLYINANAAQALSKDDILQRWSRLFSLPSIAQQYQRGDSLDAFQLTYLDQVIEERRNRLMDISWFMRCLNEPIARAANTEDSCKGHLYSLPSMALTLRAS